MLSSTEDIVALDKFFQRLCVVDIPCLWRLQENGEISGIDDVQEIVDRTIFRLNDFGLSFFKNALNSAQTQWNDRAFQVLLTDHIRHTTMLQENLVQELETLPWYLKEKLTSLEGKISTFVKEPC